MKYDLVIFDLDGTVLNTLNDLASAVNYALQAHGFPTHSVEAIRSFIGNGVANLMRRALPEGTPEDVFEAALGDFKARYKLHANDETRPYPGIPELLRDLRAAGIRVGINSNKFDAALQSLCRIHFDGLYDYAVGESEVTPKKPDPAAALRIMQALNVAPGRTVYIGDSSVDLETARNAGVASGWVAWGFRTRAEMSGTHADAEFDTVDALRSTLLSGA